VEPSPAGSLQPTPSEIPTVAVADDATADTSVCSGVH
jgi:hypothetical protein